MHRHELTQEQWNRIKDMLPGRKGHVGANAKDNRLFVNAVFWLNRTGAPWRALPERYGHWKNVHKRFSRWAQKGIWLDIFNTLGEDADMEWVMLDSTVVRVHQHGSGAKGGNNISQSTVLEEAYPQRFML